MTTANKITIVRMILVPVFIIVLLLNIPYGQTIALVLFILASVTDFIDGYIARKYNKITNFGKFMDPLADKLLVTAAILFFVGNGQMAFWAAMIIIAREFAVTGLRLVAASGGLVIAAGWSGKIKTASSLVAICIMFTPLKDVVLISDQLTVNGLCVAVMVITTVWSGVEYFMKNAKVLDTKS